MQGAGGNVEDSLDLVARSTFSFRGEENVEDSLDLVMRSTFSFPGEENVEPVSR